MDKTFDAKNGTIRVYEEGIDITSDGTQTTLLYEDIAEAAYSKPGVFTEGALAVAGKDGNIYTLIAKYFDGLLFERIKSRIDKRAKINVHEDGFRRTKIEHKNKNIVFRLVGVACVALGVVGMVWSIIMMLTIIGIIFAIFTATGSLFLIAIGGMIFLSNYKGNCPACGYRFSVKIASVIFDCATCNTKIERHDSLGYWGLLDERIG